jgi:hypothetical protein
VCLLTSAFLACKLSAQASGYCQLTISSLFVDPVVRDSVAIIRPEICTDLELLESLFAGTYM